MTDPKVGAAEHARSLQSVIAAVAERSEGRSMEETTDLLLVSLTMAGLHAPSPSWLDAVVREAVAGRPYIVATDALLLDLDQSPQREALQDAPARLRAVEDTETRHREDPSSAPEPISLTPHQAESASPKPDVPAQRQAQERRRGLGGWAPALAGAAALLLLLRLARGRRRSRREGV